jgi:hypothetical protein
MPQLPPSFSYLEFSLPIKDPIKRREYATRRKRELAALRMCEGCNGPRPFRCRFCSACTAGKRRDATQTWRHRVYNEGGCLNCGEPRENVAKQRCDACNQKHSARLKLRLRKEKVAIFEVYGGCLCSCCGELELCFLGLDHINNDGNKETVSGHRLYRKLRKAGYPPGFRVLCHNCNLGRYLNGGTCPHASKS